MPELSRFYGIIIRMHFRDHAPPHFHATYQNHEATVRISDLAVTRGALPVREQGLVAEWASLHQQELYEAWERRTRQEPLGKIEPLP